MNNGEQFFNTSGGGYEIERSLRFNSSDSAYLSRTPASAGNRKTWTWAGWVKRERLPRRRPLHRRSSPRPHSFGEFDTNGVWQPKAYSGSYGTNGFHLPFSDNSTAAALGTDTSGNGNTWTVNNISVTAGAGNDSARRLPH
jgi:hypothetical protein